ncbi:MAG TPA: LEA type 2 family protein [Quisquiliibacterium sp.]|nr:LEA type 2 family protein [Quisquiliibacterium sp.]
MNASRRRLLAAGFALPALAACSAFPPLDLKAPKLSFAGLSVPRIGLSDIDFLLTVLADNPNDVEVPLSNLQFELDLLGAPFASGGAREPTVTLPRLGTREVPIAFTVPTSRLLDLVSKARGEGGGRFEYRLRGSANWGNSPFRIPFEKTGDLEALRQLQKIFRLPGS